MSKKILITHKPTVKKLTKKEQYREKTNEWDFPFHKEQMLEILNNYEQNRLLQQFYFSLDENTNKLNKDYINNCNRDECEDIQQLTLTDLNSNTYTVQTHKLYKLFISEIKQKINSYKNQDKTKNMLDEDKIISLYEATELLVESKLKCSYCCCKMYILYPEYRFGNQWTLDRVDNNIGHHKDNCVISCLKCNLQKKRLDDDDFRFTKQMKIVKKF
jgi:hypothetical protein